jgi:hypothetical protein
MAISPINFFSPNPAANAPADVQSFANLTALSRLTGLSQTALATFSGTLGQVLAALGPLALDTTLAGTGTATAPPVAGLTNTAFELLLLTSLGQGQFTAQSVVQQLLTTQLLLGAVDTRDTLGLSTVASNQLLTRLIRQGANGNLFVQLNNLSTQLNPILFSASVLAQAFQIGNETGTPA